MFCVVCLLIKSGIDRQGISQVAFDAEWMTVLPSL